MKNNIYIVIVIGMMISACTGKKESLPTESIVSTKTITMNNNERINLTAVNIINKDRDNSQTTLNIVSRSDTSAAVALSVLHFGAQLLTGGGSAVGFSKQDLKGSNVESIKNPYMENIEPQLIDYLNSLQLEKMVNIRDVKIQPSEFKLIYDGLDSDNYNFEYTVTLFFKPGTPENTSKKGYFYETCSSSELASTDYLQPYSQWESNDFVLVLQTAKKTIESCFDKLRTTKYKTQITKAMNGEMDTIWSGANLKSL